MNPGSLAKARGLTVTVSPNPSKEWAVLSYTLPLTETRAVPGITDAQGKLVGTYALQGRQGQKLWDTRSRNPGPKRPLGPRGAEATAYRNALHCGLLTVGGGGLLLEGIAGR